MTQEQRKYLTQFRAQFGPPQPKQLTLFKLMRSAIIRGGLLGGLAVMISREHFEWSMFAAGAATAFIVRQFWLAVNTTYFAPIWSQIVDWEEVDRLLKNGEPNGDAADAIS